MGEAPGRDAGRGGGALSGPPIEPILTGRLCLEPLRVEHAEEMLPVLAAPELYAFIGGTPPTLPELRARYRQMVAGPPAGPSVGWLNWVLRLQAGQQLIGTVQATVWAEPMWPADAAALRASVAWVVGAAWQGRGYATEAAAACRDFARDVLGATRLIAIIHPDNRPSQRVAEKIGLRPEKRAVVHGGRDAVIYAASLGEPDGP
jgi:RimJ/RimL family protein N-acetyltransferase